MIEWLPTTVPDKARAPISCDQSVNHDHCVGAWGLREIDCLRKALEVTSADGFQDT